MNETICELDVVKVPQEHKGVVKGEVTRANGEWVVSAEPSVTYAGYINDPLDELSYNCEMVYDDINERYILRATKDIDPQKEILMKHEPLMFQNEVNSGKELMSKVEIGEEKELAKAAERAATKVINNSGNCQSHDRSSRSCMKRPNVRKER